MPMACALTTCTLVSLVALATLHRHTNFYFDFLRNENSNRFLLSLWIYPNALMSTHKMTTVRMKNETLYLLLSAYFQLNVARTHRTHSLVVFSMHSVLRDRWNARKSGGAEVCTIVGRTKSVTTWLCVCFAFDCVAQWSSAKRSVDVWVLYINYEQRPSAESFQWTQ